MSVFQAKLDAERERQARRLGLPLWQLDMAMATPDDLLRDLMADNRRSCPTTPATVTINDPTPIMSGIAFIPDDLREVIRLGGYEVFSRCPATVVREAQRLLASGLSVTEAGAIVSKLLR